MTSDTGVPAQPPHIAERAAFYRRDDTAFAEWSEGFGRISHTDAVQVRVFELADLYARRGVRDRKSFLALLHAADRLSSAASWLVLHLRYARRVNVDGRDLGPEDFLSEPATLSTTVVSGYVAYLASNAISGHTRAWISGLSHSGPAIDAVNLLVGNGAENHPIDDDGLTRFLQQARGRGTEIDAHCAGALAPGAGGLAERLCIHLPLHGERLVALLDGAEFLARTSPSVLWNTWRAMDDGIVTPFLFSSGTDTHRLAARLACEGIPVTHADASDPAALVCAMLDMEEQVINAARVASRAGYPAVLPLTLAQVPHAGDPFALEGDPAADAGTRTDFNALARAVWVPPDEVLAAAATLGNHRAAGRPRESEHPMVQRRLASPHLPDVLWRSPRDLPVSPLSTVDHVFCDIAEANGHLRPRVVLAEGLEGFDETRAQFGVRTNAPRPGTDDAVDGRVLIARDEATLAGAALGNGAGITLLACRETEALDLLRPLRRMMHFARRRRAVKQGPGWLGLPLIVTDLGWEADDLTADGQDTAFSDIMLAEPSDVSRVLYPADANTVAACLRAAYSSRAGVWTLPVPRQALSQRFTREQAEELVRIGALRLRGTGMETETLVIAAVGARALAEALHASERLRDRHVAHSLVYMIEPARFRIPRDPMEDEMSVSAEIRQRVFPPWALQRVFVTGGRAESLRGVLSPLLDNTALVLGGDHKPGGPAWHELIAAVAPMIGRGIDDLIDPAERTPAATPVTP